MGDRGEEEEELLQEEVEEEEKGAEEDEEEQEDAKSMGSALENVICCTDFNVCVDYRLAALRHGPVFKTGFFFKPAIVFGSQESIEEFRAFEADLPAVGPGRYCPATS
jgi:hypothetical protein